MNEYGAKAYDPYIHTEPDRPVESDPDRTFLGVLRRELMAAAEREKATHASLAEHQAKAGALTAERVAIERAIRAYQGGSE